MLVATVKLDCAHIVDWESFHDVFVRTFGFPGFYGRNMDAWIDCMTSLNEPDDGMTSVHCAKGTVLTLILEIVQAFHRHCPKQYDALIECAAFINWRRNEVGEESVLALSFHLVSESHAANHTPNRRLQRTPRWAFTDQFGQGRRPMRRR